MPHDRPTAIGRADAAIRNLPLNHGAQPRCIRRKVDQRAPGLSESRTERVRLGDLFNAFSRVYCSADPIVCVGQLGTLAEVATYSDWQIRCSVQREHGAPPLFPIRNEFQSKVSRDIRRFKKKKMAIACEIFMTSSILAGNRLS